MLHKLLPATKSSVPSPLFTLFFVHPSFQIRVSLQRFVTRRQVAGGNQAQGMFGGIA